MRKIRSISKVKVQIYTIVLKSCEDVLVKWACRSSSCVCFLFSPAYSLACETHRLWSILDFLANGQALDGHRPPVHSRPSFPVVVWVSTVLLLLTILLFHAFPFLPGRPPACSSFHLGSSVLPRDPGLRQLGWIWWQSNSSTCNWEWESVLNGELYRSASSAVCPNPSCLSICLVSTRVPLEELWFTGSHPK